MKLAIIAKLFVKNKPVPVEVFRQALDVKNASGTRVKVTYKGRGKGKCL